MLLYHVSPFENKDQIDREGIKPQSPENKFLLVTTLRYFFDVSDDFMVTDKLAVFSVEVNPDELLPDEKTNSFVEGPPISYYCEKTVENPAFLGYLYERNNEWFANLIGSRSAFPLERFF